MRPIVDLLFRKPRPLPSRLGIGVSTLVFVVTSGLTGIQLHPASHHQVHSPSVLAAELGAASQLIGSPASGSMEHAEASDGAHLTMTSDEAVATEHASGMPGDAGHHGESGECTCIGACHGGAPPTLTTPRATQLPDSAIDQHRVVRAPEIPVHQAPTDHLVPQPNAPPLPA